MSLLSVVTNALSAAAGHGRVGGDGQAQHLVPLRQGHRRPQVQRGELPGGGEVTLIEFRGSVVARGNRMLLRALTMLRYDCTSPLETQPELILDWNRFSKLQYLAFLHLCTIIVVREGQHNKV